MGVFMNFSLRVDFDTKGSLRDFVHNHVHIMVCFPTDMEGTLQSHKGCKTPVQRVFLILYLHEIGVGINMVKERFVMNCTKC